MTENPENGGTEAAASLSVYITGGATPLSLAVARHLTDAGHSVAGWVGTADEANALRAVGGLPVYGDPSRSALVADHLTLAEVDTVVHLMPQTLNVPTPLTDMNWAKAAEQLVAQTETLVTAIEQVGTVKHFVTSSFAFLYADAADPVAEDAATRTDGGDFIAAALTAEAAAIEAGAVVLRAGYPFSKGADTPLHKIEKLLRRVPTPIYLGKPENTSNWVYADDLAAAVFVATTSEAEGIYNIAMDAHPSVPGFMAQLGAQLGLALPPTAPPFVARGAMGKHYNQLLAPSVAVSSERAKSELGWSPQYTDVEAALEEILLSWRAGEMA
ncbi:MAG: NAD(P)-dependent oxidoreductase [Chloroflexota bacterium]